jgi:hypothetical protein
VSLSDVSIRTNPGIPQHDCFSQVSAGNFRVLINKCVLKDRRSFATDFRSRVDKCPRTNKPRAGKQHSAAMDAIYVDRLVQIGLPTIYDRDTPFLPEYLVLV